MNIKIVAIVHRLTLQIISGRAKYSKPIVLLYQKKILWKEDRISETAIDCKITQYGFLEEFKSITLRLKYIKKNID